MHNIKSLVFQDRPRHKLLVNGKESLTTSELLSIILRTGTQKSNALQLAQVVLKQYNNSLNKLAVAEPDELMSLSGIGESKALSIISALELSRRKLLDQGESKKVINSSKDAYSILLPEYLDLQHEEFKILLLNRSNRVTHIKTISKGGVAGTVVDQRIIFKHAIQSLSSGIILSHNHPSGNLKPSMEDKRITKQLYNSGETMGIKILDHLIITNQSYFSFSDEGLL
jgi:DNA repair protein RadC